MTKYKQFLNDLKVGDLVTIFKENYRSTTLVKKISKRCIYVDDTYFKTFDTSDGHCYESYSAVLKEPTDIDLLKYKDEIFLRNIRKIFGDYSLSNRKKVEKIIEFVNLNN